jgi:hypothetical protein
MAPPAMRRARRVGRPKLGPRAKAASIKRRKEQNKERMRLLRLKKKGKLLLKAKKNGTQKDKAKKRRIILGLKGGRKAIQGSKRQVTAKNASKKETSKGKKAGDFVRSKNGGKIVSIKVRRN